jgi:hypothetical protein
MWTVAKVRCGQPFVWATLYEWNQHEVDSQLEVHELGL